MKLSSKQKVILKEAHGRWNIFCGAVRSGKTYGTFFLLAYRIKEFRGENMLLVGRTLTTLERNVIDPLRKLYGNRNVTTMDTRGRVRIFGQKFYCVGANDKEAYTKIQGLGLSYAYGDEMTTWPENFFKMLQSRLDGKNAKFDGTCNPEGPNHWVKKFIDDPRDDKRIFNFTMEDNPFLPDGFVESLKAEYKGTVYYDRYILGRWVQAEGAVFPLFDTSMVVDKAPPLYFATMGFDFGGNKSATAGVVVGFSKQFKEIVVIDEYYDKDNINVTKLKENFKDFVNKNSMHTLTAVYLDSAETLLIRELKTLGLQTSLKNARKNPIAIRIQLLNGLMAKKRFLIMRHCQKTIAAIQDAVYDETGRRLDDGSQNVDSLDALEYAIEPWLKELVEVRT